MSKPRQENQESFEDVIKAQNESLIRDIIKAVELLDQLSLEQLKKEIMISFISPVEVEKK